MILLLKCGDLSLMGNAWSAAADGPVTNVLIHGGTVIGVMMGFPEFERLVRSRAQAGLTITDLTDRCEDPRITNRRLSRQAGIDFPPDGGAKEEEANG